MAREPRTEGRVIRKSLLESERWLTLKDNADRLAYLSLLLHCDDYGNFSGERFRLMRMWRDFGIGTIELTAKTLNELQDHGMIGMYEADGRPFIHVHRLHNTRQWWTRIYPQSPFDEDKNNPEKQRDNGICINHVLDSHKPGVRGKGLGVRGSKVKDSINGIDSIVERTPRATTLKITELPEDWREFCATTRQDLNPLQTFEHFRDYWIAKPGKDGRKLDWFATWRNWVRNQKGITVGGIAQTPSATMRGILALERMKSGND